MDRLPRQTLTFTGRKRAHALFVGCLLSLCGASGGCAAITNPVADGVPVRLAPPRECEQTIPLTMLSQPQPPVYQLDVGDVLGVYIEGSLGERTQPLPVHVGPLVEQRDQLRLPPGLGYPVPIQADGTIILPQV